MCWWLSQAHFELLNGRAIALREVAEGAPGVANEVVAYWVAMRGMMRIELEESVRQQRSNDLASLDFAGADDGVSDEQFEAQFRVYMLRIFLLGTLPPAVAFGVAKLLRALVEQT